MPSLRFSALPGRLRSSLLGGLALVAASGALAIVPSAASAERYACGGLLCVFDSGDFTALLQSVSCPTDLSVAGRAAWSRRANALITARTRGRVSSVSNGCGGTVRFTALDGTGTVSVAPRMSARFGTQSNRRFRLAMAAREVPTDQPTPRPPG